MGIVLIQKIYLQESLKELFWPGVYEQEGHRGQDLLVVQLLPLNPWTTIVALFHLFIETAKVFSLESFIVYRNSVPKASTI